MDRIINLTHRTINLVADSETTTLKPAGTVARVSVNEAETGQIICGIPVIREEFGEVVGLPDPKPGTYYLVSRLVLSACPDRGDLLCPARLVRDEEGRIVAAAMAYITT